MAATRSLNGWPGIESSSAPDLATGAVPGTKQRVTMQRDVLPLFLAFLADWNRTVMPLDATGELGPDGWSYRPARTGDGLSNHASGTAVDIRYDVLRADRRRHMTAAQVDAVHRLLAKYVDGDGRRVLGWGGDWSDANVDEMHVELAQSWAVGARGRRTVKADVFAVIKRLGIRPDGTTGPQAAPFTASVYRMPTRGPVVTTMREALRLPTARDGETLGWDADLKAAWGGYLLRHPKLILMGNRSFQINARGYASLIKNL